MSPLRLNGSTSGFTTLDAPASAGSNTLVLPTGNGTAGQVLSTNGSGAMSWTTLSIGINTAGGSVGTGATIIDFRGAGISTVTVASGIATVNIADGIGSSSQAWTNVLSSRTNGTTYTNSTGKPIMVILAGNDQPNQGLNYTFQVQGSNIGVALPNVAPGYAMIVGVHVVPNGQTYRASWNASATLTQWYELR